MNKRKMLEEFLGSVKTDPMDCVLPIDEWKHVALNNMPHIQISDEFLGMVLVARWARKDSIQSLTREDMVDMVVGSDGRTKN